MSSPRELVLREAAQLDAKVESIEKRPGDLSVVEVEEVLGATTGASRVAEVTARAGIHRGDEGELARIRDHTPASGDANGPVLQRASKALECIHLEQRQFVQKEDPVMGEYSGMSLEPSQEKPQIGDSARRTRRILTHRSQMYGSSPTTLGPRLFLGIVS
jgi:hypothetical protein